MTLISQRKGSEIPKISKSTIWFIVGVILLLCIVIGASNSAEEELKPLTKAEAKVKATADSVQTVEQYHSTKLREIRYLVKHHIKENLKDPDSFDEIDHGEYKLLEPTKKKFYQAYIKYRAKNSFGGYNVEKWCFDFDKSGDNTNVFKCE